MMTNASKQWPRLMTRSKLGEMFRAAGIVAGMDVMIHSQLSTLGYMPNGAYDVIDGLRDVVGDSGTILVPAQSGQLSDPIGWTNPPVPADWIDDIRANMEPFDAFKTQIRNRGWLPECLMRYEGVCRSHHPIASIAALGARAQALTADHPLHEMTGIGSPVHKLYEADGHVLLMGVGLQACTLLHLAEFIADCPHIYKRSVTVLTEKGKFVRLQKCPEDATYFEKLRLPLKDAGALSEYRVSDYLLTLLDARRAVDLTVEILKQDSEVLLRP